MLIPAPLGLSGAYKVTDKHGLPSGAVSNVTVNEPVKKNHYR